MESRLDVLLDLAREPQPDDEPFVMGVIECVRADAVRRSRRRRMLTGPTAVAAAAVIVVGGAVAALMRSTAPAPETALRTAEAGGAATARPAPSALRSSPAAPATEGRPGESDLSTYRRGDHEWGYESDTTAYAMDHETGLRLETEVYGNEFDTDVPHRVTLTLENTGDEAVEVSAPEGCALMVAAYPAEEDDQSSPERSDDEREAYPWQCASSDDAPRAPQERETFVLEPGTSRVAEATVVLGAQGDWGVVGMCQCSYQPVGRASSPKPPPDDNPLDRLGESGEQLPTFLSPGAPSEPAGEGLVTPPIRVKVS